MVRKFKIYKVLIGNRNVSYTLILLNQGDISTRLIIWTRCIYKKQLYAKEMKSENGKVLITKIKSTINFFKKSFRLGDGTELYLYSSRIMINSQTRNLNEVKKKRFMRY